jgi:hypothetical protein
MSLCRQLEFEAMPLFSTRLRRPFSGLASPPSAAVLLCFLGVLVAGSWPSGDAAVTAPRLDAFWKKQTAMTDVRPTLSLVRWAVQPIWWANDDAQDPNTAIDLQPQLPVLQEVSDYYLNMVRGRAVKLQVFACC